MARRNRRKRSRQQSAARREQMAQQRAAEAVRTAQDRQGDRVDEITRDDDQRVAMHVSNIPYSCNAPRLAAYFEQSLMPGQLRHVKICQKKGRVGANRHAGWALVVVASQESAAILLSLDDHSLDGRELRIQPARRQKQQLDSTGDQQRLVGCKVHLGQWAEGNILASYWQTEVECVLLEKSERRISWRVQHTDGWTYNVQIPYRLIIGPILITRAHNETCFYLRMKRPPVIMQTRTHASGDHGDVTTASATGINAAQSLFAGLDWRTLLAGLLPSFTWSALGEEEEKWSRAVDFTGGIFGQCPVHRLSVPTDQSDDFLRLLKRLHPLPYPFEFSPEPTIVHQDMVDLRQRLEASMDRHLLGHDVRYAVHVALSTGCVALYDWLNCDVTEILVAMQQPMAAAAIYRLVDCYEVGQGDGLIGALLMAYDAVVVEGGGLPKFMDNNHTIVQRVVVTPTRIVCLRPETEPSNRVLRKFASLGDRFVRLSFGDEDFNLLIGNSKSDAVIKRLRENLERGVVIGSRHYEFLAFSSSQLRSHSCWLFASGTDQSATSIRAWMGTFDLIKCVAKYAARMGQCFSSTMGVGTLSQEAVLTIPDVTRNGYTFTDGVGMISTDLARTVALKMVLDHIPSAFQIRMGGCKGMLTVWETLPGGSNVNICVRPSMSKFPSDHRELEINSYARSMAAYLNLQLVTLLSTLGVPILNFLSLQRDFLEKLHRMLDDVTAARSILEALGGDGALSHVTAMLSAGFLPSSEPHLMAMLQAEVLCKARVLIPQGICLLGVVDETGLLAEDQVFLQFGHKGGPNTIRTGKLMVSKSPMLHPGDVRLLEGVDIPALHHLVNVVVFSQNGMRPAPNQMAGSDLDGDIYILSWDPRLLDFQNHEPMDYTAPAPKTVPDKVQISDVTSFVVDYVINDNLGQIASAHLVWADQSPLGARCEQCLLLAPLHSMAVDFSKTGVPAVMPRELVPKIYPDFMDNGSRDIYRSEKALGHMYRAMKTEDELLAVLPIPVTCDPDLLFAGWMDHFDEAIYHRDCYEDDLKRMMNTYGIESEAEAVSGCLKVTAGTKRRGKGEVREKVRACVAQLRRHYREEFWLEFVDEDSYQQHKGRASNLLPTLAPDDVSSMCAKASAWYCACYHPSQQPGHPQSDGRAYDWTSFPWVVHDVLAVVKAARANITG